MYFLYRYDRFIDAFEHVANMIDDIYKVCTECNVLDIHCTTVYALTVKSIQNNTRV